MVHRFLFLILAGLKIESICSVIIQERDPLSQDWWPDYQNENQGDYTQSDLFTSTGNNQQESEYAAPIASDFFDSPDPSLSILDSDNILDAGDPDSLTLGCSSEDSSPMTGLSKGKKSKKICPATTLDLPSAATFDKKSDCKPESEICPIGKSAMCCDGETQGWLAYSGFSVGGCIKCKLSHVSFKYFNI